MNWGITGDNWRRQSSLKVSYFRQSPVPPVPYGTGDWSGGNGPGVLIICRRGIEVLQSRDSDLKTSSAGGQPRPRMRATTRGANRRPASALNESTRLRCGSSPSLAAPSIFPCPSQARPITAITANSRVKSTQMLGPASSDENSWSRSEGITRGGSLFLSRPVDRQAASEPQ
jgi:hypothetical protein